MGGVGVLVNLINDEEDDDLSNKAYQVFKYELFSLVFRIYRNSECERDPKRTKGYSRSEGCKMEVEYDNYD